MKADTSNIDRLCEVLKEAYRRDLYDDGDPRIGRILFNTTKGTFDDVFYLSDRRLVDMIEQHLKPDLEWLKYDR